MANTRLRLQDEVIEDVISNDGEFNSALESLLRAIDQDPRGNHSAELTRFHRVSVRSVESSREQILEEEAS